MGSDELELSAPAAVDFRTSAVPQYLGRNASARPLINLLGVSVFTWLVGTMIAVGILLRLFLPSGFKGIGCDENLYRIYIQDLDYIGLREYPSLIDAFIDNQRDPHHQAILPPTRVGYIVGGYVCHRVFGLPPIAALRSLSCAFSILTLLISALFCWRLTRRRALTAGLTALMACASTQIHLGQHALIDGVFGFWALLVIWLLWENLKHPESTWWAVAYPLALAGTVMTKENAFFVFAAVLGVLVCNRWFGFGRVTKRLVLTTFLGALIGFTVVLAAAGGIGQFLIVFELLKQKVPVLPYTIHTGGGPWHRYLVDLILVSPLTTILALTNILQARRKNCGQQYLIAFSCLSYFVLTAFPDGMNLRYIVMLDMPVRFLAVSQLDTLNRWWGKGGNFLFIFTVAALSVYDLWQHHVLFVKGGLYELVTEGLVWAQGIVK